MKARAFAVRALGVAAATLSTLAAGRADAQSTPNPIAVQYAWDKQNGLHGTFNFRWAVDAPAIRKRLNQGLPVEIVMRGYIYPDGVNNPAPIALTAHHCKVAWDLWNEVYTIVENGVKRPDAPTLKGVYKRCTDMVDLPIVDGALLTNGSSHYYLAVKVEVNPINAQTLAQVKSWVTRPSGASGAITPTDALFASFLGIFMSKIATADLVLDYRAPNFP